MRSGLVLATLSLRIVRRHVDESGDAPHPLRLLCARRERPRRHAAEKCDELAPPHGFRCDYGSACPVGLPRNQGTTERTAGPLGRPEIFLGPARLVRPDEKK